MKKLMVAVVALGVSLGVRGGDPISYDVSGNVSIPALEEDTTVEVASGVTVTNTAALTGSGKLTKTGAGTLVLSVAAQDFIGGIEIQTGVIDVLVQDALGTGNIDIVGTTTDKRQLHFGNNTAAMTVPNSIYVNSAGTTAVIFFDWSKIPNVKSQPKKVTLTGGILAESDLYIDDQLQSTQGSYNYVTFDCPVNAAGHTISFGVGCTPYWNQKVTAKRFACSGGYGSASRRKTGGHYFYAPNEIGEIKVCYNTVYAKCEHAFDGAVFNWTDYTADSSAGRGGINLAADGAKVPYLTSAKKGSGSTSDNCSGLYGPVGSTVTITGATDVASATAYCALRTAVTLVMDAPGFTQELAGRTHNTTGDIIVRNGTLRTSGIAAFAGLSSVQVEGGTFAYTSTVDTAFAGLTNLTVRSGATASFTSPQTALFPTDSTMDLCLETGANLVLPEGMTDIYAQYFYWGTKGKAVGDYTHEQVSGIPEGVTVHVAKAPAEVLTPIGWTGGAGENTSVASAANWGETGNDFDFSGNKYQATFAPAEAAGRVASVIGSVYLNKLTFANDSFLVRGEGADASLFIYDNGLAIEPAASAEDPARTYVLDVPTTFLADASVTVPANATLCLSNGMSSAYNLEVIGDGKLVLAGETSVSGKFRIRTKESTRLSGRITSPNGPDVTTSPDATHSDAALVLDSSASVGNNGANGRPIIFDNVVIEKPLQIVPRSSYDHYPADIQAAANSTNVILSKEWNASPSMRIEALAGSLLAFSNAVAVGWGLQTRGDGTIQFAGGIWVNKTWNIRAGTVFCDKSLSAPAISFTEVNDAKLVCGPSLASIPYVSFSYDKKYQQGVDVTDHVVSTPFVVGPSYDTKYLTGREGGVLRFTSGTLDDPACKAATNVRCRVEGALGLQAHVPLDRCLFLTNRTFTSTGPLIASCGVLELAADAFWTNGTRIVATGVHELTNGTLRVNSAKSLSKNVAAEITGLGKFEIPSGVNLRVASLTVDGEAVANGVYDRNSDELSGHLVGDGQVTVGPSGMLLIIR